MHKINHANIKEWARNYDGPLFDGILCDPPYELGFMGKSWDSSGIAFDKDMWADLLRILKPGGHLLAFSGSRTYHRMAVAIEDAGFEIRDMIEWVYGSGFPKSLNIGKAVDKIQGNEREVTGIKEQPLMTNHYGKGLHNERPIKELEETKGTSPYEGYGTALKPAHEPCVLARKPIEGTVANNVLKHGTGGLNIDKSRIISSTNAYKDDDNSESIVPLHKLSELRDKLHTLVSSCVVGKKDYQIPASDDGYVQSWKELKDYLGDCSVCRGLYDVLLPLLLEGDQVPSQQLHDVLSDIDHLHKESSSSHDSYSDHLSSLDVLNLLKSYSNYTPPNIQTQGRFPSNLILDGSDEVVGLFPQTVSGGAQRGSTINSKVKGMFGVGNVNKKIGFIDNGGSAARFFYTAKSSKSERNAGLEGFEEQITNDGRKTDIDNAFQRGITERKNHHPTVKPLSLTKYLATLIQPPTGGRLLVPFSGSGSEMIGALQAGWEYVEGVELTEEYIPIAEARIKYWLEQAGKEQISLL